MSAQVSVYGRLGQEPRRINTKSGTPMVVSSLAVNLKKNREEEDTEWFGLVAFGRQAEDLERHEKGELVSAAGRLQVNTWQGKDGERRQLQIIVDSLVSARSVRPPAGGKRQENGNGGQAKPAPAAQEALDDDIPF